MKILLTGCAGFIGSNLSDALLDAGHEVLGVDNLSTGKFENIAHLHLKHKSFLFARNDIGFLQGADLTWTPDIVIHLAALGSVPRSVADPLSTFNSNVFGTQAVFEYARLARVKAVFYASSSSVYGNPTDTSSGPLRGENDPINKPLSPYAASKAYAEILAHSYASSYGMKFVGLRFFNVFGPRQRADSEYAAVIPKFVSSILKGEPITIFGDGLQRRTFTPVEFVVNAILQLTTVCPFHADIYNVTHERYGMNVLTLAKSIFEALDKRPAFNFGPVRVGDVRESIGYGGKLRRVLGDFPCPTFMDALKNTCEWYSAQC